jgi:hypothetical protein
MGHTANRWVLPHPSMGWGSARANKPRIFAESESPFYFCERGPGLRTALPKSEDRPDDVETLTALVYVVLDRLFKVEETVALLALSAGIDAPPPSPCDWSTVKSTAHTLGCSVPNVYRLIRLRRLTAKKHAGRVLVTTGSINKQRERIAVRS